MNIRIVCPAPPGTLYGNRVTALRWARVLRGLDHHVDIQTAYDGGPCDLLLALHAKRSAPAILAFRRQHPDKPVVVALTGTDLYYDIHHSRTAQHAIEIATRLVALQPLACQQLAPHLHAKLRIIYQAVNKTPGPVTRGHRTFQVCVVGHLRNIKDPFRAAMAARSLPADSRIQIVHAGAAMDDRMSRRAHLEEKRNPRYRWLGELPRAKARRLIARSHLLVLSSRMEGGANVISEAVVDRTPVLASRIPGSIGLLGPDYPGFYPYGDTEALRSLLGRAETDEAFYDKLVSHCLNLQPLFQPEREEEAWRRLLAENLEPRT